MFYAPHILQKRVVTESRDEFKRPIVVNEEWVNVCRCRCDDNTTTELRSDNGTLYRPSYHVVCEGKAEVNAGDYCRCLSDDGVVRGEGKCERFKRLNYLGYSELWM